MTRLRHLFALAVAFCALWLASISAQGNVTAEAIQQANLRATTDANANKVGEIANGTRYPVLGRSQFYPWLLLGDPATLEPIGWVYQDLVGVQGNLNDVPFSTVVVDPSARPTPTFALAPSEPNAPAPATAVPTQAFNVAGIVLGEVNVRYGPGADYPRLGVATRGERFQIIGYHTQYPWVQVAYENSPNGMAWIARDLLDIQGNVFSLPALSDGVLVLPTLTPTPSLLVSANDGVPLRPEFVALGEDIWQMMLNARFDPETSRFASFFLMDLQTGEAITFGNDIAYSGTSVSKIEILARLYASLDNAPDGNLATDIANTMICSENVATNRLLSVIGEGDEFRGAEEVTRFMQDLGLNNTFLAAPFVINPAKPPTPTRPLYIPKNVTANQSKANPEFSNQTTVEDMGRLLASMYQCAYQNRGALIENFGTRIEPRECRQMLHVMSNNNVDALLRAGVPADVRVAHKHGWINDTHSNAAIFFTPGGHYVIVVFAHQPNWLNFEESLPVIAEASRMVYNFYNPFTPLPAVREGFIPEATTCNFAGTPLVNDLRQPVWDN
jgi:uncharacterized protein YraI